ncbi:MAG: hypothetical protein LKJ83_10325 [Eubacteriaceae bacterium]|jgi:hypothetical protein|nr:hypothetical protein [Eubacteriaceae bacterium]
MAISFTLIGLLKFVLYAALIALIVVVTVFVYRASVKLKSADEDIIDAGKDIAELRSTFESADDLADEVIPSVNSICDSLRQRGGLVSTAKNIASEGKNIKKAVDDFKAASN